MSPREQADAIRLLLRWRLVVEKISRINIDDPAVAMTIGAELRALEDDTDDFIAHGGSALA